MSASKKGVKRTVHRMPASKKKPKGEPETMLTLSMTVAGSKLSRVFSDPASTPGLIQIAILLSEELRNRGFDMGGASVPPPPSGKPGKTGKTRKTRKKAGIDAEFKH